MSAVQGSYSVPPEGVVMQVERLTIALGNGVALVQDLDLRISAGETLAIVGESGCGKSVTALALMGLLPPGLRIAGGQVIFGGEDLASAPESRLRDLRGNALSMVFQEPMTSLNPVLTIGTQIEEVVLRHRGGTSRQARSRAIELLTLVRLPEASHRLRSYPHQLSGGQRQRVMIAIALACEPRLLVADEPTTALDVSMQAGILQLLKELQRDFGLALLLITHDFGVVGQIADRVLVMYAGRRVEQGTTRAVLAHPSHPYTRLLLQARPHGRLPHTQRLAEIPGMVLAPHERGGGCAFAPRCPQRQAVCTNALPRLAVAGPDHIAACIHVHGR